MVKLPDQHPSIWRAEIQELISLIQQDIWMVG
jgi:hypothetical protein